MARVVVQCTAGHLFSTEWVDFVSFKAVRLGRKRYQRCPECGRFRMVEKASRQSLGDARHREAMQRFDGKGL
ncbi:hypothetical protein [Streptomyces sp. NPDC001604]|uniref:hypothetical protein n=1 Tax=Streptomyces sp. NPDC001604 TaxID=3364593 RepID=UPI0036B6E06D